ncbi:uncharacterized protein K452DRAFT_293037 [Aplosporella prunicola CBS 121167]|uniref:Rpr2-domain-containing protein n=1 Tax=Aplosporella prunicola CBS 121167 TaxID=1176127 RepID=A0A6A6AXH4_9PEZI|nr:uncharacterized protein K452DRAFT_293037 [Aplosporella prunicola CBS 121167]KAF2135685.1 hypothetical protein K452DRAFT_293037 [Aplosporella prunicola CBS 121167]
MAKADAGKSQKAVPNKHLHSRISYLYQAATYLAIQADNGTSPQREHTQPATHAQTKISSPYHLVSHLQLVSMKAQVRLSHQVKHSICKRCSAILIAGSTSSSRVENLSRGGKKPWADVLVVECNACGAQKRFPVGAKRQPKKKDRVKVEKAKPLAI